MSAENKHGNGKAKKFGQNINSEQPNDVLGQKKKFTLFEAKPTMQIRKERNVSVLNKEIKIIFISAKKTVR